MAKDKKKVKKNPYELIYGAHIVENQSLLALSDDGTIHIMVFDKKYGEIGIPIGKGTEVLTKLASAAEELKKKIH